MNAEYEFYIKNDTGLLVFIDAIESSGFEQLPAPETNDAQPLVPQMALGAGQRAYARFKFMSEQFRLGKVWLHCEVRPPQTCVMFKLSFGQGPLPAVPWVTSSAMPDEPNLLTVTTGSPIKLETGEWVVSMAITERPWTERLVQCLACQ